MGPHFFMEEDVVLVTLQYRLGPLGFLSLNNEDIKVP
jgi:carboxylesterase type B